MKGMKIYFGFPMWGNDALAKWEILVLIIIYENATLKNRALKYFKILLAYPLFLFFSFLFFFKFLVQVLFRNSVSQHNRFPPAGYIPEWGRSSGGRNGDPFQYSCLGNPMERGAWWATVHVVAKSWTSLSDWALTHLNIIIIKKTQRTLEIHTW